MMKKVTSGIQLTSVFLQKSDFQRSLQIDNITLENLDMKINIAYKEEDNIIESVIIVELEHLNGSQIADFSATVAMVGLFERIGEFPLPVDEFANVNAAAIVYPYIRQHVRALSLDAGINPVILPVLNFYQMYLDSKSGENI